MLAERLSRLDGREKFGLLVVVLVLMVLLLDAAVVRPINTRCAWLDADIEREVKTLAYQNGVLRAGALVDLEYAQVNEHLGTPVPAAEAIDTMKGEIDQLAHDSDVALLATKHREPRALGFYDEYALDIGDFETDEQGIVRFLHTLMSGDSTYRVTKMKLAPDNSGKRIKGSMTITKVMIAAPKAPAEAATGAVPGAPPRAAQGG